MSVGSRFAPPVAIVGVSSLFAGSDDVLGFWRDVLFAIDRITEVPDSHWLIEDYYDPDPSVPDKTYCKRGGFLSPRPFDPIEFGIPPNAIPATDTAQLLALMVAKRALADAARTRGNPVDLDRISVILGVASTTELVVEMGSRMQAPIWRKALREAGLPESRVTEICQRIADSYTPWQESSFPGLLGNVVAGRIANRLGLGGTNCVTDAACASSLSAVHSALNELYLGDSDLVLAGGVDALNDIMMYMCFSKTPAFSATGDCRPFSDKADGTIIGEGVGMVALRRLEDAERDGDSIYAVIRGLGASSDGRAASVYAPRAEGQAKALRRAYDRAGYSPATVELVEAHGTGTKAGDVAEFKGVSSIFAAAAPGKTQWCAIGSVKSQLGHTKAAAGAAGLIKTALALQHGILPPTLKVERPNPALAVEASPFYINTKARPWIRANDHPRRAGVSSFGFGGSNFHLTLEEYVGPGARAPRFRTWSEELVLLSAESEHALADKANVLTQITKEPLARIAERSHAEFDANAPARLAFVAATNVELQSLAKRAAAALQSGKAAELRDPDILFGFGAARLGGLAFLFPGQGSQYVGMGAGAAMVFERAREVWDRAADLPEFTDEALHRLVFPPPAFDDDTLKAQEKRLTEMANAQPAIGVASLAYLRLLDAVGIRADAVAGHSFGEITALAAAGAMDDDLLAKVARRRGALMTQAAAAREGAMLAVSANADDVRKLVDLEAHGLVLANDNAPGQVVLAGETPAITEVEPMLKAAGLTMVRLPVATAFHSSLVAQSCAPFRRYLASVPITRARLAVYGNTNAEPYPDDVEKMRSLLAEQIAYPVRFREMIERMYADGITRFIEVGPGRVLTGLVGRCLGDRPHMAVALDDRKLSGLRAFWRGLGEAAVSGTALDLKALSEGYDLPPMPVEPPAHAVMISGANYGKPYPPENGAAGLPSPNPERTPRRAEPSTKQVRAQATDEMKAPESGMADAVPAQPAPSAAIAEPAMSTVSVIPSGADASLVERFQRETLEAHQQYQTLMADSHKAFLEMAAQAMGQLAGMHSAATVPVAPPVEYRSATTPEPVTDAAASAVPPKSELAPPALQEARPVGLEQPPVPAISASPTGPAPLAAAPPSGDVEPTVLEIVAEKTGYPIGMLDLDMEMEAGLGIDSIKQVEILAALQEKMPGLPEVPPSELAGLKTLRDVVARLGAAVLSAKPLEASPSAPTDEPKPTAAAADTSEEVLAVVAEKTGYPVAMLDPDMEMEAGLGIDSIKQVEILAALQERIPGLPEVAPSELAELKTLRDVMNRLGAAKSVDPAPARPSAPAAIPEQKPVAVPVGNDSAALLLSVVADKTGYPVDMLDLDMEMEAGLGIDSIKQVEILAALQERLPNLPEIAPSELAGLKTLRDVLGRLGGAPAEPAAMAPAPREPMPKRASSVRLAPAPRPSQHSIVADQASLAPLTAFEPHCVAMAPPGLALAAVGSAPCIYITNEHPRLAAELVQAFRRRNIEADVVATLPHEASAVISLAALQPGEGPEASLRAHLKVLEVARTVAASGEAQSRLLVTIQSTGGDFGLASQLGTSAWSAGVAGIVKTAAHEWPEASLKAIDVADVDRAAESIVHELLIGGPALEVGFAADGTRQVIRLARRQATGAGAPALAPGSVLVVSGGARGVTGTCVAELAAAWKLRLVLIGRSRPDPWPAGLPLTDDPLKLTKALAADAEAEGKIIDLATLRQEARALASRAELLNRLGDLEALGIEHLYFAADIADEAAVSLALDEARRQWGPIAGIVHGAGVLADKEIADLGERQFTDVFRTKVGGFSALLAATREDPIQLIGVFSSIAARSGNAGQAAYAAANEVLNKLAAREAWRRGPSTRVRSFNWGPWDGGMVDASLKAHFERQGIKLIGLAAGSAYFRHELEAPGDGVERVVVAQDGFPLATQRLEATCEASQISPAYTLALARRMCAALAPNEGVNAGVEDFTVVGKPASAFDGGAAKLVVTTAPAPASPAHVGLTFQETSGRVLYEATLRFDDFDIAPADLPSGGLEAWTSASCGPWVAGGIRVKLEGISDEGGVALISSQDTFGDGVIAAGLSLGALWAHDRLGLSLSLHRVGKLRGPCGRLPTRVRCAFRGRRSSGGVVVDLSFAAEDGTPLIEIRGAEFVAGA